MVDAVKATHGPAGFGVASHAVGPARGFRKDENANAQKESPEEGNSGGDAPLSRVVGAIVLVGSVIDLSSE